MFLRRFVTMDETWIHHYTSESREGLKQWVKPGESAPKRPKRNNRLEIGFHDENLTHPTLPRQKSMN